MTRSTWGAIFDWDGVVVDSSRAHLHSWERLAREEGRGLPANHFKLGFGMKNEAIIPGLLNWTRDPQEIQRLSLRKEALYRAIIRAEGIAPLPGVVRLLARLRQRAIPCAIGSSTHRRNITVTLQALGLRKVFHRIVSAEDVTRGKPDPAIFLLAARRLALSPECCVVFEDAPVGIAAAHAAGMRVVAVATTHPAGSLRRADRVIPTLADLTVEEIEEWFIRATPRPPKPRKRPATG